MSYKLEKNFLLERRYEHDKRGLKLFLYLSIINPLLLVIYFSQIRVWRRDYRKIRTMRDEQRALSNDVALDTRH